MNKVNPVVVMTKNIMLITLLLMIFLFENCKKEQESGNSFPLSVAGQDQSIALPLDSAILDGKASKDNNGAISKWYWKMIDGPGPVEFSAVDQALTVVRHLQLGLYKIELEVTDDQQSKSRDTLQISVYDPRLSNTRPLANAGEDQHVLLPRYSVELDGSLSSDPENNIVKYSWKKISGPEVGVIQSPSEKITSVLGLSEGKFDFELIVLDAGGLSSLDTVRVVVANELNCGIQNREKIGVKLVSIGMLSESRRGLSTAAAGTKIIFAGATNSDEPGPYNDNYGSSAVDIYDVETRIWTSAELSKRRANIAAVSAGNKIFLAGGRLGDGAFDELFSTVDIYDAETNSWSVASLSAPRAYIGAAHVGNLVMFAGGEKDHSYRTSDIVDIYNIQTETWTSVQLSQRRAYISAISGGKKIYFAGGHYEDRWYAVPSSNIDVYDDETKTWSVSRLPRPMGWIGGAAVEGKIIWTVGCDVSIYEPASNKWTEASLSGPAVWDHTSGQQPVAMQNKLLFFKHGGEKNTEFDIYDLQSFSWTIGVLPFDIQSPSVVALKGRVFITGKRNTAGAKAEVWELQF